MTQSSNRTINPGDGYFIRTKNLMGMIRVISIDKSQKVVHLHKVSSKKYDAMDSAAITKSSTTVTERSVIGAAKPIAISLSEFLCLNDDELIKLTFTPSFYAKTSPSQLNSKQREKFFKIKDRLEDTWATVKDYLALELGTYSQIINTKAKKHCVHRTTLARDMSRFYECGLDSESAAMMTLFSRAVHRATSAKKRIVKKKLGRPNKRVKSGHDVNNSGNNVTDKAKDLVQKFLQTIKDREGKSYVSMFTDFKVDFALRPNGTIADGLILMEPDPELQMTVEQFRYHIKKCETPVERQIKKVGKKTFNLKDRVQISYAKKGIGFPGHTYLIDSTIIDVYCVSAVNRRLLIGRPVVYVVIDAFSQMILSVHVALEGPDMDQAKIALYRAISSKDEHFKNLGVVGCTDAFVQGVKPLFIFADRGEMLSKGGRNLAECVQLAESFAASYRADWKSLVERYFGVQNTGVVHWLPGAVRKRQKERGDRDYRLDAVLTVNELTRILLNQAAEWNLTHDMSQHVSCNMLEREIDATPRAFWDYGLAHLHGSGTYIEKHAAVKNFLPTVKAKADKRGLHVLENMRFTANWMRDKSSYFEIIESSSSADIFLNPDKPMGAYFLDSTDNNLMECDLVDTREYQSRDIALEDIRMFEEYQPLKEGDGNKDKQVINDSFAHETKKIIRNAHAETKDHRKTDDRSKTKRVSDIKGSRAKEVNSDFESVSSAKQPPSVPVQKTLSQSWYSKFIDNINTDTK